MCMFLAIVVEAEHDTRYPIFRINSLLSSDVYINGNIGRSRSLCCALSYGTCYLALALSFFLCSFLSSSLQWTLYHTLVS